MLVFACAYFGRSMMAQAAVHIVDGEVVPSHVSGRLFLFPMAPSTVWAAAPARVGDWSAVTAGAGTVVAGGSGTVGSCVRGGARTGRRSDFLGCG